MKICSACKQEKVDKDFYVNNRLACKLTSQCKTCILDYSKKKRLSNPAEVKRKQRAADLKKRYNITPEEYDRMLREQDNKCGICNQHKKLGIDHCHKSGKVRMLLCINCNSSVGIVENCNTNYEDILKYI